MERFFGSLKSELFFHRSYPSKKDVKRDVKEWIEMFYNNSRLHSKLGYMTPMEYDRAYHFKKCLKLLGQNIM